MMIGDNFSMTRNMQGMTLEKEDDMLGGKDSMHTNQMISDTNISMHSNYWIGDKEAYYLDDVLYNKDDQKDVALSEKVLETLKILK